MASCIEIWNLKIFYCHHLVIWRLLTSEQLRYLIVPWLMVNLRKISKSKKRIPSFTKINTNNKINYPFQERERQLSSAHPCNYFLTQLYFSIAYLGERLRTLLRFMGPRVHNLPILLPLNSIWMYEWILSVWKYQKLLIAFPSKRAYHKISYWFNKKTFSEGT